MSECIVCKQPATKKKGGMWGFPVMPVCDVHHVWSEPHLKQYLQTDPDAEVLETLKQGSNQCQERSDASVLEEWERINQALGADEEMRNRLMKEGYLKAREFRLPKPQGEFEVKKEETK